ncbi:hypothetical protein [Nocardiopsis sp. CNT312]|uniref:hypothetical protein n=1 Tax=Nocardiopsis sp. CNT312 TaxID=1137268 RepID=UPI00048C52FA|nr:hypothetical protein [Nocardiopsis sp. CNT312]
MLTGTQSTASGAMHQIHFSGEGGLLGPGPGPSATSLPGTRADHDRLATWNNRLAPVAAPRFAGGQARDGYWYRRFDDGQGVLLYRLPGSEGREGSARALFGTNVTPTMALICAASDWLGGAADASPGWGSLQAVGLPSREQAVHINGTLDSDALAHPALVNLVTAVLSDPFSPVDVLTSYGTRELERQERIVLMWGLYRALYRVLGRGSRPRFPGIDWSFATHEPWPTREESGLIPPRIAFRPPYRGMRANGAGPVDLSAPPRSHSAYRDVAGWLTNRLNSGDEILSEEEWRLLTADPDGAYARVLESLHNRAAQEGMATGSAPAARAAGEEATERVPPRSVDGEETDRIPPPVDEEATESLAGGEATDRIPPPPAAREELANRAPQPPVDEEATDRIPPRPVDGERTDQIPPPPAAREESTEELPTGGAVDQRLRLLLQAVEEARDVLSLERAVNGMVHQLNPGFMGELEVRGSQEAPQRSPITANTPFLVAASAAAVLFLVCLLLLVF